MNEPRSAATNPNQGIDQRGIDKDFPLLYEMAQQYDFVERLGGSNAPVLEEADRALRELWMARGAYRGRTTDGTLMATDRPASAAKVADCG